MDEPVGNIVIARLKLTLKKANTGNQLFQSVNSEFLSPAGNSIAIDELHADTF